MDGNRTTQLLRPCVFCVLNLLCVLRIVFRRAGVWSAGHVPIEIGPNPAQTPPKSPHSIPPPDDLEQGISFHRQIHDHVPNCDDEVVVITPAFIVKFMTASQTATKRSSSSPQPSSVKSTIASQNLDDEVVVITQAFMVHRHRMTLRLPSMKRSSV